MSRPYPVISADSHITEPPNTFWEAANRRRHASHASRRRPLDAGRHAD